MDGALCFLGGAQIIRIARIFNKLLFFFLPQISLTSAEILKPLITLILNAHPSTDHFDASTGSAA